MATFPRLALISTGFPQFTASIASGYPSFSRVVAQPNVVTFSPTTAAPTENENPITMSPTPFNSPNPFISVSTVFPPELKIPESDYDYEELSHYDIIRDKLELMKIGWPLTQKDEHEITMHLKLKDPNATISTQLIKNAFLRGDEDQKKAMLEITDKIGYTL